MTVYLDSYLSLIPDNQKDMISNVIEKSSELNSYSPEVILALKDSIFQRITQYKEQTDIMDSSLYNEMVGGFYADLQILYKQSELLDALIYNSHMIGLADIAELKKELTKLRKKVFELREATDSINEEIVGETFLSTDTMEEWNKGTMQLYCDRNGDLIHPAFRLNIETENGWCKLPMINGIDYLHNARGLTTAEINDVLPSLHEGAAQNNIENAIDNSGRTYWGLSKLMRGKIEFKNAYYETIVVTTGSADKPNV